MKFLNTIVYITVICIIAVYFVSDSQHERIAEEREKFQTERELTEWLEGIQPAAGK